jgi:hypothetical protein
MDKTRRPHRATKATTALAVSLATVAGALALGAAPAMADQNDGHSNQGSGPATVPVTPGTLPPVAPGQSKHLWQVKRDADRAINERVNVLNVAVRRLATMSYMGQDATTLTSSMQQDVTNLQALKVSIDAATTVQQAMAGYTQIFTDYRVYYLVLPAAQGAATADWLTSVKIPTLTQQVTQLQGLQNTADQAVLGPIVSGMQSLLQTATTDTTGVSAQLLSYTAQQWDANHNILFGAQTNLRTASGAIAAAERDYARAEEYLTRGLTNNGGDRRGR